MNPLLQHDRSPCGAFLILAAMSAVLALAGCSSNRSASYAGSQNAAMASSDFDSGAGRPPTAKTLYATSRLLGAQNRRAEQEQLLRRIISENPNFMPAYLELAKIRLAERDSAQAIAIMQAGLAVSPRDSTLLNNIGICRLMQRHYAAALEAFTRAAGHRPQNRKYRGNMATALCMLGRYLEAKALYQQILPESEVEQNLGVLIRARKQSAESRPAALRDEASVPPASAPATCSALAP